MKCLKICLVIPAYNEEKRIAKTLELHSQRIIKKFGENISIVVFSDSTDKTNQIVRQYAKRYSQISLIEKETRQGKGAAVLEGFKFGCYKAKADIVGFVDADSSVPESQIEKLIKELDNPEVAGTIGSRYLKESKVIGKMRLSRFIASRIFNITVRLLFGFNFKDTQCGAKFFRSSALKTILTDIVLTDMSFDVNLLYELKRHNFNIVEVPIKYKVINTESKIVVQRDLPKLIMIASGYRISRSAIGQIIPSNAKHILYRILKNW